MSAGKFASQLSPPHIPYCRYGECTRSEDCFVNALGFDDLSLQGRAHQQNAYVTITAKPPANRWIQCYWKLEVPHGTHTFRGVPGNNIDCIFQVPDADQLNFAVMPLSEPRLFVISGPATFFGIRLRVLAQHWLNPMPIGEWQGESLQSLLGESLLQRVIGILNAGWSLDVSCDAISAEVLGEIVSGGRTDKPFETLGIDPRLLRFLHYAYSNRSTKLELTDKDCSEFAISSRHLRRLSKQYLGLSPRNFYRVIRFQRMLNDLYSDNARAIWTECYYDQAHFIREFKELSGLTPGQFRNSSVLYNTG